MSILFSELFNNEITTTNLSTEETLIQFNNDTLEIQNIEFQLESTFTTLNQLIEIENYLINNNDIKGIDIVKADLEAIGIQFDNKDVVIAGLENVVVDAIKKVWDFIVQLITKIIHFIKSLFINDDKLIAKIKSTINELKDKNINYSEVLKEVIVGLPYDFVKEFLNVRDIIFSVFNEDLANLITKDPENLTNEDIDKINEVLIKAKKAFIIKKANNLLAIFRIIGIKIKGKDETKIETPTKIISFKVEKRSIEDLGYNEENIKDFTNGKIFETLASDFAKYKLTQQVLSKILKNANAMKNIKKADSSGLIETDSYMLKKTFGIYCKEYASALVKLMRFYHHLFITTDHVLEATKKHIETKS